MLIAKPIRLLILAFAFCTCAGLAQNNNSLQHHIDSIQKCIAKAKHDTIVLKCWKAWDDLIYVTDPELDFQLNTKIDSLCKRNLKNAKSPKLKRFYTYKQSGALNVMGIYFYRKANYGPAINAYSKCIKLKTQLNDSSGIAKAYSNLGNVYTDQLDFEKARNYYKLSLNLILKCRDSLSLPTALQNYSNNLYFRHEYDSAINCAFKCLYYFKKFNNMDWYSTVLGNIGKFYYDKKEIAKAELYTLRSLSLADSIHFNRTKGRALRNLSQIYLATGKYKKTIDYCLQAFAIAQADDEIIEQRDAALILIAAYKKLGDYKNALNMFEIQLALTDTIVSEKGTRLIVENEFRFQYDRKTTADSIRLSEEKKVTDAELAKQDVEIKIKRNQQLALYGGLALVLLFAFIMVKRFNVIKEQKKLIVSQKALVDQQKHEVEFQKIKVEEKNKEVIDSIIYARRIQQALLPSHKYIQKSLTRNK